MFEGFGIEYKNFVPSLCSLKTIKNKLLSGVRVSDVKVCCNLKNKKFEEIGEILFKDDGISGIVIFNLSSFMARENCFNYDVFIDFMHKLSTKDLENLLNERKQNLKNLTCENFFTGFFHKAINLELLKKCDIDLNKIISKLSELEIKNLSYTIKNYKLKCSGYFENNQVMSGGINLDCLDENLQSKINKNLYFIGEVCDVDGVCGGYNLQWAWTSGKIVGENL